MNPVNTQAMRAIVVEGWFKARRQETQAQYLARVVQELGVHVAPRTLRSWLATIDSGGASSTRHIRAAWNALAEAQQRLAAVLDAGDAPALEAAPAAAASSPRPCVAAAEPIPHEAPASEATAESEDRPVTLLERFSWDLDAYNDAGGNDY